MTSSDLSDTATQAASRREPQPFVNQESEPSIQHDAHTTSDDLPPLLSVPVTAYRLASSLLLLGYGTYKTLALYRRDRYISAFGASDVAFAVLYIIWMQWMGYAEAVRPKVYASFFHEDYSRRALRFLVVDAGIVLFGVLSLLALNAFVDVRIKLLNKTLLITDWNGYEGKFVAEQINTTIPFQLYEEFPEAIKGRNRFPLLRVLLPAIACSTVVATVYFAYVVDGMIKESLRRRSPSFMLSSAQRSLYRGIHALKSRPRSTRAWALSLAVFSWMLLVLVTHAYLSFAPPPSLCFKADPKIVPRAAWQGTAPHFYGSYNSSFNVADVVSLGNASVLERDVKLGGFNHSVSLHWFDSIPDTFWWNVKSYRVCGLDTTYAVDLYASFGEGLELF